MGKTHPDRHTASAPIRVVGVRKYVWGHRLRCAGSRPFGAPVGPWFKKVRTAPRVWLASAPSELDARVRRLLAGTGFPLGLPQADFGWRDHAGFQLQALRVRPVVRARRMSQTAARLVDFVIPHVPVQQWVLSLPIHLALVVPQGRPPAQAQAATEAAAASGCEAEKVQARPHRISCARPIEGGEKCSNAARGRPHAPLRRNPRGLPKGRPGA